MGSIIIFFAGFALGIWAGNNIDAIKAKVRSVARGVNDRAR